MISATATAASPSPRPVRPEPVGGGAGDGDRRADRRRRAPAGPPSRRLPILGRLPITWIETLPTAKPARAQPAGGLGEQRRPRRRRPTPAGGAEVAAQITEPGGAEQRVAGGVRGDVGVGVPGQPGLAGPEQPGHPARPRRLERVHVGADADPLAHELTARQATCSSASARTRSSGRVIFRASSEPGTQVTGMPGLLHQAGVVGERIGGGGVRGGQHVTPEALRRLHAAQHGPVDGAEHDLARRRRPP